MLEENAVILSLFLTPLATALFSMLQVVVRPSAFSQCSISGPALFRLWPEYLKEEAWGGVESGTQMEELLNLRTAPVGAPLQLYITART